MRGRIVVQVQPFLILRQEHFLEIVLDFFFFDVSKHFDLLFLSLEQILVRGKLSPDPVESIVLVLVFFREDRPYRIDQGGELSVAHCCESFAHVLQMGVQSISDVTAAFSRRLDKEPATENVSDLVWTRGNYIAKLLFGSQLIKGRLI
jgi:hypothetical protein